MSAMLLSDEIRQTREEVKAMRLFAVIAPAITKPKLLQRLNTFIELAELLEDDLHLARIKMGEEQAYPDEATILRFPTRIVLVPRSDDGGDAA
jgi:hypothetical protein